jgi:hypothetical protein
MTKYIITLLTLVFIQACIPPSIDKTEKITKPDNTKIKDFGIQITGETIYQFYQKYGFTDQEEQLILIVRPDNTDLLSMALPFDSVEIKKIERIDMRKLVKDKPINFEPEKTLQTDIRIESKEFDSGKDKIVHHVAGKYRLVQNDSVETVYIFDSETGLLYIESKK